MEIKYQESPIHEESTEEGSMLLWFLERRRVQSGARDEGIRGIWLAEPKGFTGLTQNSPNFEEPDVQNDNPPRGLKQWLRNFAIATSTTARARTARRSMCGALVPAWTKQGHLFSYCGERTDREPSA